MPRNRDDWIDALDELYGRMSRDGNDEEFAQAVRQVTGQDFETFDDSDPGEGFYAYMSTDEIEKIYDILIDENLDVVDTIIEALQDAGFRAMKWEDRSYGSEEGIIDATIEGNSYRIQIYRN